MAKLINWNNFNKGFGETFNYTLNNERRLQQQQAQFNQEMEYRNRQSGLDQDYRRENIDLTKEGGIADMLGKGFKLDEQTPEATVYGKGFDYPPEEPQKMRPLFDITQTFPNEQGTPTVYGISKDTLEQFPLGTDYSELTQRMNANKGDKEKEEKTPYFDLTKSGDLFSKYQDIESAERIPDTEKDETLRGQYQYMTKDGAGVRISPTQKAELKRRTMDDLTLAADNEARQINSKVPGFYSTYQALLNMVDKPEDIDRVVNENLGSASVETRDAIKTLLRRRIFK